VLGPPLLELPAPDGSTGRPDQLIAGWWTSTTSGSGTVIPDGAVDLVVNIGHVPIIAGPDVEPRPVALLSGSTVVGVRLRPGVAGQLLGDGLDRVVGHGVPLDQVWARPDADRLLDDLARVPNGTTTTLGIAGVLAGVVAGVLADAVVRQVPEDWDPDPVVIGAVAAMAAGSEPDADGLGSRQFRRRFTSAMGYGPAMFRRIARLDRFSDLVAAHPQLNLADLAARGGYYDQAHLARDCRQLLGMTPTQFCGWR